MVLDNNRLTHTIVGTRTGIPIKNNSNFLLFRLHIIFSRTTGDIYTRNLNKARGLFNDFIIHTVCTLSFILHFLISSITAYTIRSATSMQH